MFGKVGTDAVWVWVDAGGLFQRAERCKNM